jgi:hypothetical protein
VGSYSAGFLNRAGMKVCERAQLKLKLWGQFAIKTIERALWVVVL